MTSLPLSAPEGEPSCVTLLRPGEPPRRAIVITRPIETGADRVPIFCPLRTFRNTPKHPPT